MSITLYGNPLSGHVHRVEMFLAMLGLPYHVERTMASDTKTPEFLAINPYGQIPALRDGDRIVCDSNAIIVYLALRYDAGGPWYPQDPLIAAEVQRWLSFAAAEVRFGLAVARAIKLFGNPSDLAAAHKLGNRFLVFMDGHLAGRDFLAHSHATLADIACYSYVARSPEGGYDLTSFVHIQAWLRRIEALPRFLPMPETSPPV